MTGRTWVSFLRALAPWLALALAGPAAAAPVLAPFKDALFAYPPLTAILDEGAYVDVDYSEDRDIDRRDEVPERRVRSNYVDLEPLARQSETRVATPAGPLSIIRAGETAAPKAIVLFIHGRGGDRRLGMNDRTFGGNFNRLKNLMDRAGGLYVTADAGTFSTTDADRIAALVETLKQTNAAAPFVLACGSMGGEFCWDLLVRPRLTAEISGIVMLSANNVPSKIEAMRRISGSRAIPLVLAHGTRDTVFAWGGAKSAYEMLREDGYPVRFISFDSGNHGTPIRMIDWRDTLNWIFGTLP